MKKSVLFFSVVLMLLMSESSNLFAQKTFPENPNQGYIDTGIGKGDLIQILNLGDTLNQPSINKITYSDSLVWQVNQEDRKIYFWHIDSLSNVPNSLNGTGSEFINVDIVVTENLFITGGKRKTSGGAVSEAIYARLKSNPSGPLYTFNPNAFGTWGNIKELFKISDNTIGFYAFDSSNNRVIKYEESPSSQLTPTDEIYLTNTGVNSSNISGLAGSTSAFFLVNADNDSLYKVDMNGQIVSSYSPNSDIQIQGTTFELGRPFMEPNGRLTVTMTDTTTNGSQNLNQYLLFLTDELEFLDILELPANGARGEYGVIQEVVVDDYGNIYVSDDISLELKQLEYFNHQPLYAPKPGPKTIFNAPNYSTQFYPPLDAYITEGFDYFDWNAGDQVGAIKITGLDGDAEIRYDSDNNGSFETTYDGINDLELTIDDIINNRMFLTINASGADTLARIDAIKVAFHLGDRAGAFTADADTMLFNTYKAIFGFDGVPGKDSWRLMTPVIDGITFEDYLRNLEIIPEEENEKALFPQNDTTFVYLYNSESEEYEPLNILTDTLNRGDAFFVRVPEDTDTSEAGVQGGWPRSEFMTNLERETVSGSSNIYSFLPDTFMVSLIGSSVVDFPERNGVNLVGNPFGQTWRWSSNFAELAGVSPDVAVWNHLANNGDGAWEYPTYPDGNTEVWIKPDQAVAVFAEDANASLGFRYSGVTDDVVSPDVLGEEKFVVPKRILATLSDSTYSDSFYITKTGSVTGRRIPKMINITGNYHEVFVIGAGGEGDRNHYFSAANDFDTLGVAIKFGVRSTISDSATITIQAQDLSEFDSLYVKHSLMNGDSVIYQLSNGTFTIPLVDSGKEYTHEGTLEIILEKENRIINSNEEGETPLQFTLSQNYPNPFNPNTQINFQVPADDKVSLKVYDILGREVATLVNELKAAGSYSVNFDAGTLSSGMYMYRLETTQGALTRKMMLMK